MIKECGKDHPHLLPGRLIGLPLRAAYVEQGRREPVDPDVGLGMGPAHVLVNAVAPTFVLTPFTRGMFEDKGLAVCPGQHSSRSDG